ncbi:MAG: glutaredoxin family protein [Planctomycetes bacterium]|nr:glutaredoxin family protein [Planctomycetota bacterium]
MKTILYTRAGCHLCDIAEQTLREHGLQPRLVDIDKDEALREQFDACVPVVEIDGKVRFRGHVDPTLLRRLLHNAS